MSLRGDIGGSDSGNNSDETTSRTDGRFLQTAAPGARQGTMADSFETNLLRLLQATREQKAAFAADAKRIAERCRTEHADAHKKATEVDGGEDVDMTDAGGAKTGALCRTCFNGLLAAVYAAYTTPAQPQWYASRQAAFLGELDRLLDDVRVLRAPLALVDEWVAAQKRAWLQGQLVEAAALQRLVGSAATATTGRTGLATKLVDPDTDVAEVLRAVVAAEAVARTPNGTDDRDTGRLIEDAQTAARALQQTTSRSEQGTIFRDSLFPGGVPELAATRTVAQRLLDGTVGLDEGLRAVEQALGGGENAAGRAGKMEKHRKRLAELRRAKAAHEAQKLKRMKPVDVPYFLQDEAPCATCGRSADPQRSPFCLVCFLEVDYCLRENQTVWCTVACMKESYANHFAATHPCAAGDRCARSKPEPGIARQEPRYFFCRECVLSFGIRTFYCNDRCAGRDFQQHRETVHLPNRAMRADTHDDGGDLSYSSAAQVEYTAADIAKHLIAVEEAFAGCQKKHPDWALAERHVQLTLPWPT